MSANSEKRTHIMAQKSVWVHPPFQMKVLIVHQLMISAFFFCALALGSWLFNEFIRFDVSPQVVSVIKSKGLIFLCLSYLGCSLISTLWLLSVTYRFAMPVVRLVHYFKDVAFSGQILPLYFRQGDHFQELPSLIHEALKKLENTWEERRAAKKAA